MPGGQRGLLAGVASDASGLGFTLGALVFGRWRKA